MTTLHFFWTALKMLYQIFLYSASLLTIVFNIFWFIYSFASAGLPCFTLLLLCICFTSKLVQLRSPDEKKLLTLLGINAITDFERVNCYPEKLSYWPIANRGAWYDAPENSKAALKKCVERGYHNVLLDAGITACGEIVIVHSLTLEHAGLSGCTAHYTLEELRKINITRQHPLGTQYEGEHIYTLQELLEFLDDKRLTIFLLISDNSARMLEKLKLVIKLYSQFTRRTIIISRSPYAIYQLRKHYPGLICGFWTSNSYSYGLFKASLIVSIYGAILRNFVAPVIGISVVFVCKEEFNFHIDKLWRNVGVHPIVYNVNSPNEKRYFQKTMKAQYLTDSLRSEPQLSIKT